MVNVDIHDVVGRAEKQSLDKGTVTLVLLRLLDDVAAGEPEAAHLNAGRTLEKLPEKGPADRADKILPRRKMALLEDAEHDVRPLLGSIEKLPDLGRMILHVVVHPDDEVPVYIVERAHNGGLLAEVLGQIDADHVRPLLRRALNRLVRSVL